MTKERAKVLEQMSLEVGTAAMRAMSGAQLTLQEGLTVLSMAVSTVIGMTCQLSNIDEKEMIDSFCESLKCEEV